MTTPYVRSKIRRVGGTRVTMNGVEYHFTKRDATEAHIAPVTDAAHLARFLSFPEGYERHSFVPVEGETATDAITAPVSAIASEPLTAAASAPVVDDTPAADDKADEAAAEQDASNEDAAKAILEDALYAVLDGETTAREDLDKAYKYFKGRNPKSTSSDDTVMDAIMQLAEKEGILADDEDGDKAADASK